MKHRVPADLRERAVAAVDAGQRRAEVVRAYGIDPRTLERWLARARRGEALADRPRSGRPPKIAPAAYPALRQQIAQQADATLEAHCQRWTTRTGVRVSPTTMGRLLATLGLPLKKNGHRHRTG
ncbi:MAG: helix-turn-helix domain-containing protein [Chloroflexota bacterium]|nr:helix-turn-helix domain-containing protein [Chloroflexota bacterium]